MLTVSPRPHLHPAFCFPVALMLATLVASPAANAAEAPIATMRKTAYKTGKAFRSAFREVSAAASRATVRVKSEDKLLALGTIVDANGLILTKASELTGDMVVELSDGRELAAEYIGVSREHDLAMLRVSAANLPVVKWREAPLAVGQWLVSPDSNSEMPLSVGVVSTPPRKIIRERGILGITIEDAESGARIARVFPDSGASRAGLKPGDIVRAVAGQEVGTSRSASARIGSHGPGDLLELQIVRGEDELNIRAKLGAPFAEIFDRQELQNRMGGALSMRRAGFPSALQHDSVLLPNQCGGPIVDLTGEIVGINIARAGRIESYALPVSEIQPLIAELRSGRLAPPEWLVTAKPVSQKSVEDSETSAGPSMN